LTPKSIADDRKKEQTIAAAIKKIEFYLGGIEKDIGQIIHDRIEYYG